jgi:integrase
LPRQEVHKKLTDVIRKVHEGKPVPVSRQTVGAYLNEWLDQVAVHRVRASTLQGYRINVRKHINPRIGSRPLGSLSPRDIRLLLDDLGATGLSPRSVQYVHATLRVALEHAVREELLPRNAAKLVQPPTPTRPEREPLAVDEARRLRKGAREDRLFALYVVAIMLGLRRSEALALRWEDVDLDKGCYASVRHFIASAGHWSSSPPRRRDRGGQFRFRGQCVRPCSITVFVNWMSGSKHQALCNRAGVRRARLNDLRHTCVSLLLDMGEHPRLVMEIVGHTALEMTMNVYGHVSLDSQRAALNRLDDLLGE